MKNTNFRWVLILLVVGLLAPGAENAASPPVSTTSPAPAATATAAAASAMTAETAATGTPATASAPAPTTAPTTAPTATAGAPATASTAAPTATAIAVTAPAAASATTTNVPTAAAAATGTATASATPTAATPPPNASTAATAPAPPAASDERGGGRSGRRGSQFLERLKSQYPNEVAEIEALRATDPEGAGNKMRELMSKAGFSRGGMRGGFPGMPSQEPATESNDAILARLKEKFPEEFAAYEELKKTDPEKAALKLQELLDKAGLKLSETEDSLQSTLRDRNRHMVEWANRELKTRYPERYAALEKLREDDPDAARREFRKMVAEAGLEIDRTPGRLQYEYIPANSGGAATGAATGATTGNGSRFGNFGGGRGRNGGNTGNSSGNMPMPPWGGGPPPGMTGGQ